MGISAATNCSNDIISVRALLHICFAQMVRLLIRPNQMPFCVVQLIHSQGMSGSLVLHLTPTWASIQSCVQIMFLSHPLFQTYSPISWPICGPLCRFGSDFVTIRKRQSHINSLSAESHSSSATSTERTGQSHAAAARSCLALATLTPVRSLRWLFVDWIIRFKFACAEFSGWMLKPKQDGWILPQLPHFNHWIMFAKHDGNSRFYIGQKHYRNNNVIGFFLLFTSNLSRLLFCLRK